MKVMLKECHLIDLSQVQFACLKEKIFCCFNGIIHNYLIRLVFINGKEEEIVYKDKEEATNDFELFTELSAKGEIKNA